MGFVFRLLLVSSILVATPAYSQQCEQLFYGPSQLSSAKMKSALKGTLFFTSATGFIWGGLELTKTLEQNQAIFVGFIAGAVVYGFFNTLVTPFLLPLQNKLQRMSFRMLYNSELSTTIKHKKLHDYWRDNNTHFGPNESMGRNHYMAVIGKAFHRMTYANEQLKNGDYKYAIAVYKDLLLELKYYPEIFNNNPELQSYLKTHVKYLPVELRQKARETINNMVKEDPEFKEVSEWLKDYLEL